MPLTDVVAVVGGTNRESANYIINNIDKGHLSKNYQDQLLTYRESNPLDNFEKSDAGDFGWGYVIATTTNVGEISVDIGGGALKMSSVMKGLGVNTPSDALSLSIIHGMGHTAGLGHPNDDNGIMSQGLNYGIQNYMFQFQGNVSSALVHTFNNFPQIKQAFFERFGEVPGP